MTYKNERQLKEEIFLFCLCMLILKYGLQTKEYQELAKNVEDKIRTLILRHSQKSYEKWQRMIARINIESGVSDLIKNGESSHRAVLTIYSIVINLKINNYKIPEEIEELVEMLLDIENKQPMADDEWLKLKKSTDKRGLKILAKLRELGFFNQINKI